MGGAAVVAGILGDMAGAICLGGAVGLAKGARAGKAVGEANAGVEIGEVSADASAGFTNVFGGAFGGGVDSDLIFTRAFSAACRSEIPSQPCSTIVCDTVSLTFRGRSAGWALAITGAATSITSPLMTGPWFPAPTLTVLRRSRRRRSMGCSVRVRSSS